MTEQRISRERLQAPPGTVYTETVLKPSYDFKLEHYFEALVDTNKAWTVMLCDTGIIPQATAAQLCKALEELEQDGRAGMGAFNPEYEYFYSTMEHYLSERVGEAVSGEINIGRTRPEPLARMALRRSLLSLMRGVTALEERLIALAEREQATVMPMWTHMQHAQVATVGHYLLGIVHQLERDGERLIAAYRRANQSTLGCGALSGSSYPLDRRQVAALLGFDGVVENTNDCVAGGDYMLEAAAAVAAMMIGVSRLCQDCYTWHTQEFAYLSIGDDYSGSSSLMPQKKNPYPFEYVRTLAAHAAGEMSSAFATLHNTNFQDTKDVEEGLAPPVFRSLAAAERALRLLEGTLSTAEFDQAVMRRQAGAHFATSTELAAVIHRQTDLSYRTAHRVVGHMVLMALQRGLGAGDVDAALVREAARQIIGEEVAIDDHAVRAAMDPQAFVEAHNIYGGTAPAAVAQSLAAAAERHREFAQRVQALGDALEKAGQHLGQRVDELAAQA